MCTLTANEILDRCTSKENDFPYTGWMVGPRIASYNFGQISSVVNHDIALHRVD
jgi:hypothetical protein